MKYFNSRNITGERHSTMMKDSNHQEAWTILAMNVCIANKVSKCTNVKLSKLKREIYSSTITGRACSYKIPWPNQHYY